MSTIQSRSRRDAALDLTKGMLVIFMVVYHAVNCTTRWYLAFEYMAFLPPSFILIAGFLVAAQHGRGRPAAEVPLPRPAMRLIARGAKLVAVFTLLNVAIQLFVSRSIHNTMPGLSVFFENWYATYILGDGRLAAFDVLLPIGYFLMLSPLFLAVDRWGRIALVALLVFGFAGAILLERSGVPAVNAQMVLIGVIGMVIGRIGFAGASLAAKYLPIILAAYLGIFFYGLQFGVTYWVQVLETLLGVGAIYGFCLCLQEGRVHAFLQRLGQYSLLAYIAQIAILQVIARWMGRPVPLSGRFWLLLAAALIVTGFIVEMIQQVRNRSRAANVLYKSVFA
jgi:hypothetical protein